MLGTGTLSSRQERTSRLEFDVVSVKENKALGTGGMMRRVPGGGITATHMRATSLITFAYELQSYELVGAPE